MLGLMVRVFPDSILIGTLLWLEAFSIYFEVESSIRSCWSGLFITKYKRWNASWVIDEGLLIKLLMVSSSISFLKDRALLIVRIGYTQLSYGSSSSHKGLSWSSVGLVGG
jgi:hypothetical protein